MGCVFCQNPETQDVACSADGSSIEYCPKCGRYFEIVEYTKEQLIAAGTIEEDLVEEEDEDQ